MGAGKLERGLPKTDTVGVQGRVEGVGEKKSTVRTNVNDNGVRRRRRGKVNKEGGETQQLRVAHLNICGGWSAKKEDIMSRCDEIGIDVMVCTETQLPEETKVTIEGWKWVGRGRPVGCHTEGGICIMSRKKWGAFELNHELQRKKEQEKEVNKAIHWIGIQNGGERIAIGGVYVASGSGKKEWNNELYRILEEDVLALKTAGWRVVVVGDFNGHVGKIVKGNWEEVNANGKKLLKFSEEMDLTIVNTTNKCTGVWTWMRGEQRSVIDFILADEDILRGIESMVVDDEGRWEVGSDHNISWVVVSMKDSEKGMVTPGETGSWIINDRTEWEEFRKGLSNRLTGWSPEAWEDQNGKGIEEQVETMVADFTGLLIETANNTIKKRKKKGNGKARIGEEVMRNMKARKKACKAHRRSVKEEEPECVTMDKWKEYQRCRGEVLRAKRKERGKKNSSILEKIGSKVMGPKAFWNHWKSLKGRDEPTQTVRNDEGRVYKCKEVAEEIAKHWERLNTPHTECNTGEQRGGETGADVGVENNEGEKCRGEGLMGEFTRKEIEDALKKTKRGKACGQDRIPNEFLLEGGEALTVAICKLFNWVLKKEVIPKIWRESRTVLLHKGGDRELLDNYRGITINSNLGKLFTRIIGRRLEDDVEERGLLGEIQHAFRRGRRGTDALFVLTHIMDRYKREGKELIAAFLDVRKAYDRVWRKGMWQVLEELGYGGSLLRIIQALYKDLGTVLQLGSIESRRVSIRVGLKQGCVLSPLLFALYIRKMGWRLMNTGIGACIGEMRIPGIFFADDMVLFGQNKEEMASLLKVVSDEGEKLKLSFNIKKSKVMLNGQVEKGQIWELGNGGEGSEERGLEEVEDYKYLGVTIRAVGKVFGAQAANMAVKAKRVAGVVKMTANDSCNIVEVGRRAWEAVARPAITYGSEIILLSKAEEEILERVQRDVARYLLGVPLRTATAAVLGELGWWQIRDHLAQAKLNYAGRLWFADTGMWCKKAWMEGIQKCQCMTEWWKELFQIAKEYGVNLVEQVVSENSWKGYVKKCMKSRIEERWRGEVGEKSSLKQYTAKRELYPERYHGGDWESILVARARCGQLELRGNIYRWQGGDRMCPVCIVEVEDLNHFMAGCTRYQRERQVLLDKLKEIWGKKKMGEWEGLGEWEKISWVLGFKGETSVAHWQAIKDFMRTAWQNRTAFLEEYGEQVEGAEEEDVPEDWAGYCRLV